jgi:hypothetical protein
MREGQAWEKVRRGRAAASSGAVLLCVQCQQERKRSHEGMHEPEGEESSLGWIIIEHCFLTASVACGQRTSTHARSCTGVLRHTHSMIRGRSLWIASTTLPRETGYSDAAGVYYPEPRICSFHRNPASGIMIHTGVSGALNIATNHFVALHNTSGDCLVHL